MVRSLERCLESVPKDICPSIISIQKACTVLERISLGRLWHETKTIIICTLDKAQSVGIQRESGNKDFQKIENGN